MKELWCYRFSCCHLNKACLNWTEETKERRKAREVHGGETGAGGLVRGVNCYGAKQIWSIKEVWTGVNVKGRRCFIRRVRRIEKGGVAECPSHCERGRYYTEEQMFQL